MTAIFIGFGGRKCKISDRVVRNGDELEVWDLTKFSADEFDIEIKKHIVFYPTPQKELSQKTRALFGHQTVRPVWGILVKYENLGHSTIADVLSICNLYSDSFLNPIFTVEDGGLIIIYPYKSVIRYWTQDRAELFMDARFRIFFDYMKDLAEYASFNADNFKKWILEINPERKKEYFRMFLALTLFYGLEKYDFGRSPFTYAKEIVDIAVIFESLFTQPDEKTEVTYRLKKRCTILLGGKFANIEKEISKFYDERSTFIHGAYFVMLAKEMKLDKEGFPIIPTIDSETLRQYRTYVRFALVGYMYLFKKIIKGELKYEKSVTFLLEDAILNTALREKINNFLNEIFAQMAKID